MRRCVLLLVGMVLAWPAARAERTLWTGRSAGFTVRLSDTDLTASDATGKPIFSARAQFIRDQATPTGRPSSTCRQVYTVSPLSLVGPLLSYRVVVQHCAGNRVQFTHSLVALDLRHPDAREQASTSLTRLFPEGTVVAALKNDAFLRPHLGADARSAVTLDDLSLAVPAFQDRDGCRVDLSSPLDLGATAESFAFDHLEGGQVAVRAALYALCGPNRTYQTLGVLLSMPTNLKSSFLRAAASQEGFLMRNAPTGAAQVAVTTGKGNN